LYAVEAQAVKKLRIINVRNFFIVRKSI
jgi:hypothetical protein